MRLTLSRVALDHDVIRAAPMLYVSSVAWTSATLRPGAWVVWIRGLVLIGAGAAAGCEDPAEESCDLPRGPRMAQFEEVTASSGIDFHYVTTGFQGGGLAVADLDGDGLPEVVAGRREGGLAMFHNRGRLRFAEVRDSGLDPDLAATAMAAADLDNDGDRDLVIASAGVARVMANQGDGRFVEAARLEDTGSIEHVLATDLDGDGLLDLYLGNYDFSNGPRSLNRLYLNRGGLAFAAAGMIGPGLTWTTTAWDADGDGDQDLYVANDTLLFDFGRGDPPPTPQFPVDLLLRNDGPGMDGVPRFTNIATGVGLQRPRSSMGGLLGDFDGDGRLDLYIPDYGSKKLFVGDLSSGFADRAAELGVLGTVRDNAACGPDTRNERCLLLSWSAALSDFDLDGHDELIVVNGATEVGRPPPVLMFARGSEPAFHEVSPSIGCIDARGMVVTDLDGDGDQDLVLGQKHGPLEIYRNVARPAPGSWLRVELRGRASNREGVGALVTAHLAGGRSPMRVVAAGGVIHSSSPAEAFFGLGGDEVLSVEVRWPAGKRTEVSRPDAGATLVIEEDSP
jgi:hypothetical protein